MEWKIAKAHLSCDLGLIIFPTSSKLIKTRGARIPPLITSSHGEIKTGDDYAYL